MVSTEKRGKEGELGVVVSWGRKSGEEKRGRKCVGECEKKDEREKKNGEEKTENKKREKRTVVARVVGRRTEQTWEVHCEGVLQKIRDLRV